MRCGIDALVFEPSGLAYLVPISEINYRFLRRTSIVRLPPSFTGRESAFDEALVYLCDAYALLSKTCAGTVSARRFAPSGALLQPECASVYTLPAESAEHARSPLLPRLFPRFVLASSPAVLWAPSLSLFRYVGRVGETSAGHR
jgi:hypothetical protein